MKFLNTLPEYTTKCPRSCFSFESNNSMGFLATEQWQERLMKNRMGICVFAHRTRVLERLKASWTVMGLVRPILTTISADLNKLWGWWLGESSGKATKKLFVRNNLLSSFVHWLWGFGLSIHHASSCYTHTYGNIIVIQCNNIIASVCVGHRSVLKLSVLQPFQPGSKTCSMIWFQSKTSILNVCPTSWASATPGILGQGGWTSFLCTM